MWYMHTMGLVKLKKEVSFAICDNMGEPGGHYTSK